MFTGIITDIGCVTALNRAGESLHLRIRTSYPTADIAHGASIACNGVCLTVTETGEDWFAATASPETLAVTTLGGWQTGRRINLERALKLGDELGGHLVLGHVDGVAEIIAIEPQDGSHRLRIRVPEFLKQYCVRKGSVAIDGISLTINAVSDDIIELTIIPHSWQHTALSLCQTGDAVNIEADLFARYIERQLQAGSRVAA